MRFMIMHKNDANTEAGKPPPMTSADRSLPPRSLPLFSGDAASSSGTAIIIPAETGTAHDGTG